MAPIRGNGDFLAYGSPRVSTHPCLMLGFMACGRIVGDVQYAHSMAVHVGECRQWGV